MNDPSLFATGLSAGLLLAVLLLPLVLDSWREIRSAIRDFRKPLP